MNKDNLFVYKSPHELANSFATKLIKQIIDYQGNTFHLAISGGNTPSLLFAILADNYIDSTFWQNVHFWWTDERVVPPLHPESNYGNAKKLLLNHIDIPESNIHRIRGENTPADEALAYQTEISNKVRTSEGWPMFDLILLGMGDDGHTASIFPDQMELLKSEKICDVATHPISRQKRITLTGKTINNAQKVCFLIAGSEKAERVHDIFSNNHNARHLPASHIKPANGCLEWHIDKSAHLML